MRRATGRETKIGHFRTYAGRTVRVRLRDGSVLVGVLRTDLLSERSIAVFLGRGEEEGATIYIQEIVGIWPTS